MTFFFTEKCKQEIGKKFSADYCFRAAAQSKLNNHIEAISDCVEALKIDPNYSKAYGRKG